jgi:hypothetical protein
MLLVLASFVSLFGEKYSLKIRKDNALFNIVGTEYYLDIPLYLGSYTTVEVIFDVNQKKITVEDTYFKTSTDYNFVKVYEKIELPYGTLNESGFSIRSVFIPAAF